MGLPNCYNIANLNHVYIWEVTMLKKVSLIGLSGAILTALAAGGTPGVAKGVTLKWQTFIPPVANPSKFYKPWAAKIAKDSGVNSRSKCSGQCN